MSSLFLKSATGRLLASLIVTSAQIWSAGAQNRILGGYEISIEEFPFQLGLEGGRKHFCGASILTKNWALTAAHCVYNQPVRWLSFRAGTAVRESGGSVHPVKFYVYHELYDPKTLDYDVAVAAVQRPFAFDLLAQPVSLPNGSPRRNERAVVAGWGFLEQEQLRKPKQLTAVALFIYSWEDCKKIYPAVSPRMMCAGDIFSDICNGDSGGPLVRGGRQQVGVASWGYGCGDGRPSVYTNVSSVKDWIMKSASIDDFLLFPVSSEHGDR